MNRYSELEPFMQDLLAEATNSQTLIVLPHTSPAPFTILAILDGFKGKPRRKGRTLNHVTMNNYLNYQTLRLAHSTLVRSHLWTAWAQLSVVLVSLSPISLKQASYPQLLREILVPMSNQTARSDLMLYYTNRLLTVLVATYRARRLVLSKSEIKLIPTFKYECPHY